MKEDPRVNSRTICGITRTFGDTEFICIRAPHEKLYKRNRSDGHHQRGGIIYDNNPVAEQHYMVNRWPNRRSNVQPN